MTAKNGFANKQPAYWWYPKDFESDEVVKLLTFEQQGIYRKLLDHQWLEGSIPEKPDQIASLLGFRNGDIDRFSDAIWPLIAQKFVTKRRGSGRLVNRRLERVRAERLEFLRQSSRNGKKGAQKRWAKRR